MRAGIFVGTLSLGFRRLANALARERLGRAAPLPSAVWFVPSVDVEFEAVAVWVVEVDRPADAVIHGLPADALVSIAACSVRRPSGT